MDDGSHVVAVLPTGTDGIHQPGVAYANQQVADAGTNALTGNFLYVAHPTAVGGLVREGIAQGGTDGMGREVLHMGCQVQQLMLVTGVGMNHFDGKLSVRQRACLVEHHRVNL